MGLLAIAWLWTWSSPAASECARERIESDYPALAVDELPRAQAIVVLGGAIQPGGEGRRYPDLGSAADRMWHGARLFHAGKAPRILLSGGADASMSGIHSEARAMGDFMSALGVPASALLFEEQSSNTRENAALSAALLKAQGMTDILLVTSALHMARAVMHFEAAGLNVHPASADHEVDSSKGGPLRLLPSAIALDGSARAIKEWVAQWWWRWR